MTFLSLTGWQVLAISSAVATAVLVMYLLKPPPAQVTVASTMIWRRLLARKKRPPLLERLRWLLSLLLALSIGLLLALALGEPVAATRGMEKTVIVLVMDNSRSMEARSSDGRLRWQHAVERARGLVNRSDGSGFAIVDTCGSISTPVLKERFRALQQLEALQLCARQAPRFPVLPASAERRTKIYLISDGVSNFEVPDGVAVLSVFESAENVGVAAFETRPVPTDASRFEAYLQVTNFSRSLQNIQLQILGGSAGNPAILERELILGPAESRSEIFDLSPFPAGPVEARITAPGDSFAADDRAFSYLPERRSFEVLFVSEKNPFLESLLTQIPAVTWRQLAPSDYSPQESADLYIFDRYAPPVMPGAALLFQPGSAPWLPQPTQEVVSPVIAAGEDHPLLDSVSLQDLWVDRIMAVAPDQGTRIAGTPEAPLILAGTGPHRWIELTFGLEDSNFALLDAFPVFVSNALEWLRPSESVIHDRVGQIEVALKNASIATLQGTVLPSTSLLEITRFETRDPGLYRARSQWGQAVLAVNLNDPKVSDINNSRFSTEPVPDSLDLEETRDNAQDLWVWLLGGALLFLVGDYWTYHRKLTV